MKDGPLTEIDVHSWNRYAEAQKRRNIGYNHALIWEMHRMSIERVRELERVTEARNIVAAASEGKDADTRTSGERREGTVFAGE